jgi:hypothetical protein
MDRTEAAAIAVGIIDELRSVPYDALVTRLLGDQEIREVVGESGVEYQVEIEAMWDRPGRLVDLRVFVAIYDGSFRGFLRPETQSFIVAPDGSFVGE